MATVPLLPCVTPVMVRATFSKVSALAPLVPVNKLAVMAVSSAVLSVSAVMSATAVTVRLIVLVSTLPSLSVTLTTKLSAPL